MSSIAASDREVQGESLLGASSEAGAEAGAGAVHVDSDTMPDVMAAARSMWEASLRGEKPDVEGFVQAVEAEAARSGEAPMEDHERAMLRAWADVSEGGVLGMGADDMGLDVENDGVGGEQGPVASWDEASPVRYRFSDPELNPYMPRKAMAAALQWNREGRSVNGS